MNATVIIAVAFGVIGGFVGFSLGQFWENHW